MEERKFDQGIIIDLDEEELVLEDIDGNPVNCKDAKFLTSDESKEIHRGEPLTEEQLKELGFLLRVRSFDK